MSSFAEQRSSPRVRVSGAYLRLLSRDSAHVLDISAGGALLETNAVVLPGARGQLGTRLNQRPFAAAVQVSHVSQPDARGAGAKARVGIAFTSMDKESREALASFLGAAGESES